MFPERRHAASHFCKQESLKRNERPVSKDSNIDYVEAKLRDFLCIDVIKSAISVKWIILDGNKYTSGKSMIIVDVDETCIWVGKGYLCDRILFHCF